MLKKLLSIFIILILIDSLWLYLIKDKYKAQIENIQKESLSVNMYSAILVYVLLAFGIYYLLDDKDLKKAFIFGLVTYGVYDFTNGALLKNWDFNLAIGDTIWGGILVASTVYVLSKIE